MQRTTGAHSILSHERAYTWFRRLTGSDHLNRVMVAEYIQPAENSLLLDVGCGPADILRILPPSITYYGLDLSPEYIAAAKRQHAARGTFLCQGTDDLDTLTCPKFDRAIALGVLHHLDDQQVLRLLSKMKEILQAGGKFVTYDPCFTRRQNPIARMIHKLDRGMHVRYDDEMLALVRTVFPQCRHWIRTDLTTVPSTVLILNCPA